MKRRAVPGLLLITIVLLSTGCWNRRELNELSIAMALGLDLSDHGGYIISVQLVNPSQISSKKRGPEGTPVATYHTEAQSVFQGLRKLTTQVNRRIYLSHLRMVVIGEELARKGIGDPIDFLSRDHEMRTDFFLVVAKNTTAGSILEILTPEENIPANKMYTSLDMSEKSWAGTSKVSLDELIDDLASEGKSPVMTGLYYQGPATAGKKLDNLKASTPDSNTQYDGIAVFKKDKLLGWLDEEQSKGYQYIQNKVKSTVIVNECQGGNMDVELIRTRTKMKGSVRNGEPQVDIRVQAEGNLADLSCSLDLSNPQSIRHVERLTEDNIREKILSAVRSVQSRYKSDIFGFGEVVRRAEPKQWRKLKQNWDSKFQTMNVQTSVDVKVRRIGTINESITSRVRK